MERKIAHVLCMVALANSVDADTAGRLTSARAVALAIAEDPILKSLAHAEATERAMAHSDAALPNPQLVVTALNLPVDTFAFDQEPMTQARFALRQAIPPGKSRALAFDRRERAAAAVAAQAQARRFAIARDVSHEWLDLFRNENQLALLQASKPLFGELVTVAESLYSVGGRSQQDVLSAMLELDRLDDRILEKRKDVLRQRSELRRWIGTAAEDPLPSGLETRRGVAASDDWRSWIDQHPAVLSLDEHIEVANVEVALARQRYKPGWHVELAYGVRSGTDLDGSDRADLFSAGVALDLPLRRRNRQDRQVTATLERAGAAEERKRALVRLMLAEANASRAEVEVLQQRERLYTDNALPTSRRASAAALAGYRSDTNDFDDVLRAYLTELDLEIRLLEVRASAAKAHATLEYLAGGAR